MTVRIQGLYFPRANSARSAGSNRKGHNWMPSFPHTFGIFLGRTRAVCCTVFYPNIFQCHAAGASSVLSWRRNLGRVLHFQLHLPPTLTSTDTGSLIVPANLAQLPLCRYLREDASPLGSSINRRLSRWPGPTCTGYGEEV